MLDDFSPDPMPSRYHRLLMVFFDGVGLAPAGPDNPLGGIAAPALERILGGPLTEEQCQHRDGLLLSALDARLGVEGLPQSATGQTALFTGINAAQVLGRHVTGLPGPRLRGIVARQNLFLRARRAGLKSTFANAYSPAYLEALSSGRQRASVTTWALLSSGLSPRGIGMLARKRAVSWDIVREQFGGPGDPRLPSVSPREAGRHLSRIAMRNRLTVYETFVTDLAGHRRAGFIAAEAWKRADGLIAGILESRCASTTLLVTSDHGNLEDSSHCRHTLNPVPLLVVGPLADRFVGMSTILEVTPRILTALVPPS